MGAVWIVYEGIITSVFSPSSKLFRWLFVVPMTLKFRNVLLFQKLKICLGVVWIKVVLYVNYSKQAVVMVADNWINLKVFVWVINLIEAAMEVIIMKAAKITWIDSSQMLIRDRSQRNTFYLRNVSWRRIAEVILVMSLLQLIFVRYFSIVYFCLYTTSISILHQIQWLYHRFEVIFSFSADSPVSSFPQKSRKRGRKANFLADFTEHFI